jgi:hypothetical protein
MQPKVVIGGSDRRTAHFLEKLILQSEANCIQITGIHTKYRYGLQIDRQL